MTVADYTAALHGRRVRVFRGSVKFDEVGSIIGIAQEVKRVLFDDGNDYWLADFYLELLPEPNNNPLPLPG